MAFARLSGARLPLNPLRARTDDAAGFTLYYGLVTRPPFLLSIRFYAGISPYVGILAMDRLGAYPDCTFISWIIRA